MKIIAYLAVSMSYGYTILTIDEFNEKVNEFIAKGWVPFGGVSQCGQGMWVQAMVKYSE